MSKKLLIDFSSADETRIALTENGKLDDFEIENTKKFAVKGDIYLAKITRVEPSLQAAFVDYGANRHGFLPLTEIHPDYFKIPVADQKILKKLSSEIQTDEDVDEIVDNEDKKSSDNDNEKQNITNDKKKKYLNFFKKYKIQEVIKPKQVILVQINKEERGLKGSALTTFLSFAGRYCVLMPNSLNNDGISRKIDDAEERKKLKDIIESINIPEKMSVIIRTAGIGKTKKEISKDLDFLTSEWNKIREKTLKSSAPTLIYEEGNLIKRTIRDMVSSDVDEVIIDGKDGYEIAKKYAKKIVPQYLKNIKLFKNKDKTLFNNNNIENQINDLFSLKINLNSGGSIVINNTEALVAIDVNSGKNTTERNIENTALKTNIEAAVEIARQLRLRDLGGLVVIDFIDMDDFRNNFKVEKTLRSALHRDRARVQIGRISMFGLLELSRQRLRTSLIDRAFQKCHYCNGSGIIMNTSSISDQIIKVVNEKLINKSNTTISVKCNTALSETLLNTKREEIKDLEDKYNSKIRFILDDHFSLHDPLIMDEDDNNLLKKQDKKETKENENKTQKANAKKNGKSKKNKFDKVKKTKKSKNAVSKKITKEEVKEEDTKKTGWWTE